MRKFGVLALLFSLSALSISVLQSCGGSGGGGGITNPPPPPPPPPTTCPSATLCMLAASFSPTQITVTKGAVVGFENGSGVTHNVVFDDPKPAGTPPDVGSTSSGTVNRTFGTSGTFDLHCTIHGGMTARVIVN